MTKNTCDIAYTPVCIVPTHTAIENVIEDPTLTPAKLIGIFGPEILGIIAGTMIVAGTKTGRRLAKGSIRLLDKGWEKLVVEPFNNEYIKK